MKNFKKMLKNRMTSLKLSKFLADNGFEGDSEVTWRDDPEHKHKLDFDNMGIGMNMYGFNDYFAYDILNDLCCKYAKEIFGEEKQLFKIFLNGKQEVMLKNYIGYPVKVMVLLQQNRKQEAEDYIWENCLFNKNKK